MTDINQVLRDLRQIEQNQLLREQAARLGAVEGHLAKQAQDQAERDKREEQERQRLANLPKCPACGSPLEGEAIRRCPNCTTFLLWPLPDVAVAEDDLGSLDMGVLNGSRMLARLVGDTRLLVRSWPAIEASAAKHQVVDIHQALKLMTVGLGEITALMKYRSDPINKGLRDPLDPRKFDVDVAIFCLLGVLSELSLFAGMGLTHSGSQHAHLVCLLAYAGLFASFIFLIHVFVKRRRRYRQSLAAFGNMVSKAVKFSTQNFLLVAHDLEITEPFFTFDWVKGKKSALTPGQWRAVPVAVALQLAYGTCVRNQQAAREAFSQYQAFLQDAHVRAVAGRNGLGIPQAFIDLQALYPDLRDAQTWFARPASAPAALLIAGVGGNQAAITSAQAGDRWLAVRNAVKGIVAATRPAWRPVSFVIRVALGYESGDDHEAVERTSFWVRRGNKARGPVSHAQLIAAISAGQFRRGDLVSTSPRGPWEPLERCKDKYRLG